MFICENGAIYYPMSNAASFVTYIYTGWRGKHGSVYRVLPHLEFHSTATKSVVFLYGFARCASAMKLSERVEA